MNQHLKYFLWFYLFSFLLLGLIPLLDSAFLVAGINFDTAAHWATDRVMP